ncbi:hypothetical protein [Rhodococcus sp. RS1C4]|nr:hypothetical protein [Rhodococcus sp. RS1C4]
MIDEGYDPDDPHARRAIAGVVTLLRGVADAERTAHHEAGAASASMSIDGCARREIERTTAAMRRESVSAEF